MTASDSRDEMHTADGRFV